MNPFIKDFFFISLFLFFVKFGCTADLTSSTGLKENEEPKTNRILIHDTPFLKHNNHVRRRKRSKHDWKTKRKRYIIRSRPMSALALQYAIYSLRSQKRLPVRRDLEPWDPAGYSKITSNADVHNDDEGETRVFTSIKRSIEDDIPELSSYLDSQSIYSSMPAPYATLAPPALTDAMTPYLSPKSEIPNNFMGSNMQIYTDNFGSPIMSMSSSGADYRYTSEKRSRVPLNPIKQRQRSRDEISLSKRSTNWIDPPTIPSIPLKFLTKKFWTSSPKNLKSHNQQSRALLLNKKVVLAKPAYPQVRSFNPLVPQSPGEPSKNVKSHNQPRVPLLNKKVVLSKPAYPQVRSFNPFVPQRPGEYPLLSLVTPTATLNSISVEPLPVQFYQRDKGVYGQPAQMSNTLNFHKQPAILNEIGHKSPLGKQSPSLVRQSFASTPLGSRNHQTDYKFIDNIVKPKKPINTGNNYYSYHAYEVFDKFKKVARPRPLAQNLAQKINTAAAYAKKSFPNPNYLNTKAKLVTKGRTMYVNKKPVIANKRILIRNAVKEKAKMHKLIPILGSVLVVPPSIKFNKIDSKNFRGMKALNNKVLPTKSVAKFKQAYSKENDKFSKEQEKKNALKESVTLKAKINKPKHKPQTLYFLDENKSLVNYTIPGDSGSFHHKSHNPVESKRDGIEAIPSDPVADFEKEIDEIATNETILNSTLQQDNASINTSLSEPSKEDLANVVQVWFANQTDIENSKLLQADTNDSTTTNETNNSSIPNSSLLSPNNENISNRSYNNPTSSLNPVEDPSLNQYTVNSNPHDKATERTVYINPVDENLSNQSISNLTSSLNELEGNNLNQSKADPVPDNTPIERTVYTGQSQAEKRANVMTPFLINLKSRIESLKKSYLESAAKLDEEMKEEEEKKKDNILRIKNSKETHPEDHSNSQDVDKKKDNILSNNAKNSAKLKIEEDVGMKKDNILSNNAEKSEKFVQDIKEEEEKKKDNILGSTAEKSEKFVQNIKDAGKKKDNILRIKNTKEAHPEEHSNSQKDNILKNNAENSAKFVQEIKEEKEKKKDNSAKMKIKEGVDKKKDNILGNKAEKSETFVQDIKEEEDEKKDNIASTKKSKDSTSMEGHHLQQKSANKEDKTADKKYNILSNNAANSKKTNTKEIHGSHHKNSKRYNTLKTHYLISSKNYKNHIADAMKRTHITSTRSYLPTVNALASKIRNTFLDNEKVIQSLVQEYRNDNEGKRNNLKDSSSHSTNSLSYTKSTISKSNTLQAHSTSRQIQTKSLLPIKSNILALKDKILIHKFAQKKSQTPKKLIQEDPHLKAQKKSQAPKISIQEDPHLKAQIMNENRLATQIINKLNTNIKYLIQAEKKQLMENVLEKKQGVAVKKHFLNRQTTKDALTHINSDIEELMCQYRSVVPVFHPSAHALPCQYKGDKRVKGNSTSNIPWNLYNINYVIRRLNDNLRFIMENHKMFKSQGYKNKNGQYVRYNVTKAFPIKTKKLGKWNAADDVFPTQSAKKPTGKYTSEQNLKNSPKKDKSKNLEVSPKNVRKIKVEFIIPTSKNGSMIWPYATATDNEGASYDVTISPSNKTNQNTNKNIENKKLISNLKQLTEIANKMKNGGEENEAPNEIPEIGEDELKELITNVHNLTHSLSTTYNKNEVEGIKTLESLSRDLTLKYADSAKQHWKKLNDDLVRITKKQGIPTKRILITKSDNINSKNDFDFNESSGGNSDGMNVIEDINDTETEIEKKQNVVRYNNHHRGNVKLDQQTNEIASMIGQIDQDEMKTLNHAEYPVFPNKKPRQEYVFQKIKPDNSSKKDTVKQDKIMNHKIEKNKDYTEIVKDFQNLADDIITHSDIQSDAEGIKTLTKMFNEIEKANETKSDLKEASKPIQNLTNISQQVNDSYSSANNIVDVRGMTQNSTNSSQLIDNSYSTVNNHFDVRKMTHNSTNQSYALSQNQSIPSLISTGIMRAIEANKEKNETKEIAGTIVEDIIHSMDDAKLKNNSKNDNISNLNQTQATNSSKKDEISTDMNKMYEIIDHVKRHINNNINVFKMLKKKMTANNMTADLLDYFNPQLKTSNRSSNNADRRTDIVNFVYPDDKYDEINNIIHEFMSHSNSEQVKKSGESGGNPADEVYNKIYKKLDDVQNKVDKIIQNIEQEAEKKQNAIQQKQDKLIQKSMEKKPSTKSSLLRYRKNKNHLVKKDNNTQQKSVIILKRVDTQKRKKIGGDGKAYIKFVKPLTYNDGVKLEVKSDLNDEILGREKGIENDALKEFVKSDDLTNRIDKFIKSDEHGGKLDKFTKSEDHSNRLDSKSNGFARQLKNETEGDSDDEFPRAKVAKMHRILDADTISRDRNNTVFVTDMFNNEVDFKVNGVHRPIEDSTGNPLTPLTHNKVIQSNKTNISSHDLNNSLSDDVTSELKTAKSEANAKPFVLSFAQKKEHGDKSYKLLNNTNTVSEMRVTPTKNVEDHKTQTYASFEDRPFDLGLSHVADRAFHDRVRMINQSYTNHHKKGKFQNVYNISDGGDDDDAASKQKYGIPNSYNSTYENKNDDEEEDETVTVEEEIKKDFAKGKKSGESDKEENKKPIEVTAIEDPWEEKEENKEQKKEKEDEKDEKEKLIDIKKIEESNTLVSENPLEEKKENKKQNKESVEAKVEKEKLNNFKKEDQNDTLAVVEEEDKDSKTKVVKTLSDFVDILKNNFQTVKSMLKKPNHNETGIKADSVEKAENINKEEKENNTESINESMKKNTDENKGDKPGVVFEYDVVDNNATLEANKAHSYKDNEEQMKKTDDTVTEAELHLRNITIVPSDKNEMDENLVKNSKMTVSEEDTSAVPKGKKNGTKMSEKQISQLTDVIETIIREKLKDNANIVANYFNDSKSTSNDEESQFIVKKNVTSTLAKIDAISSGPIKNLTTDVENSDTNNGRKNLTSEADSVIDSARKNITTEYLGNDIIWTHKNKDEEVKEPIFEDEENKLTKNIKGEGPSRKVKGEGHLPSYVGNKTQNDYKETQKLGETIKIDKNKEQNSLSFVGNKESKNSTDEEQSSKTSEKQKPDSSSIEDKVPKLVGDSKLIEDLKKNNSKRKEDLSEEKVLDNSVNKTLFNSSDELPNKELNNYKYLVLPPKSYTIISTPFEPSNIKFVKQDTDKFALDITPSSSAPDSSSKEETKHDDNKKNLEDGKKKEDSKQNLEEASKKDDDKKSSEDGNKGIQNATISSILGSVVIKEMDEKPAHKNQESSEAAYTFTNLDHSGSTNLKEDTTPSTENIVKIKSTPGSDSSSHLKEDSASSKGNNMKIKSTTGSDTSSHFKEDASPSTENNVKIKGTTGSDSSNNIDEYFSEVETKNNASLSKEARINARKKKINETLKFIDIMEGEINELLDEDKKHEAFLKLTNSPHREGVGEDGPFKIDKSNTVPTESSSALFNDNIDTATTKKHKEKKKKMTKTKKHEKVISTKEYFKNYDSNVLNIKDTFGEVPKEYKEYLEPTAGHPMYATTQSQYKNVYDQTGNDFISTPVDDSVAKVSRISRPTHNMKKQGKTISPWNDYDGAEKELNQGLSMKDGVNANFDSATADVTGPTVGNMNEGVNYNTEYNVENQLLKADSAAFGMKQSPSIDSLVTPIKTDDMMAYPSSKPTTKNIEEFDPAKTPIQEDLMKYQGVENYEGVEDQPNLKQSNGRHINNRELGNDLNVGGSTKVTDGPFQYTIGTQPPFPNITNFIRRSDEIGEIKQANYVNNYQRNEMNDALAELRQETRNGLKNLFSTAVEKQRNFIDNIEGGGQARSTSRSGPLYPGSYPGSYPTSNYAGTTPENLGTPIGRIDDSLTSQAIGPPIGKIVDTSTLQAAYSPTTNTDDSVIPPPAELPFVPPS